MTQSKKARAVDSVDPAVWARKLKNTQSDLQEAWVNIPKSRTEQLSAGHEKVFDAMISAKGGGLIRTRSVQVFA